MEVIYTGLHQTPEQIVETVIQEDADAVGLSILSGAHMTLVPRVIELLREQDAEDVVVTVGGTIPAQDIDELKELGVAEVFTPGRPDAADHRLHRGRRHALNTGSPDSVWSPAIATNAPPDRDPSGGGRSMHQQDLTPIGGSIALSALCALLPLVTLLVLIGGLKWRAQSAAVAALAVGVIVAVAGYGMPVGQAVDSGLFGSALGVLVVLWITFNAIWIYNLTVDSGHFAVLRRSFSRISPDQRVQAIVIAFAFGALLEALAGGGAPVAVCAVMLIALGFDPLKAAAVCLLANTAPVAFGGMGNPITVLEEVTGPAGRRPGGDGRAPGPVPRACSSRSRSCCWSTAGAACARSGRWRWSAAPPSRVAQFAVSNFGPYKLTDIGASLVSAAAIVLLLRVWTPARSRSAVSGNGRPAIAGAAVSDKTHERAIEKPAGDSRRDVWLAYVPYVFVIVIFSLAQVTVIKDALAHGTWTFDWPGLDIRDESGKGVDTVYELNYLGATGTLLFAAGLLTMAALKISPRRGAQLYGEHDPPVRLGDRDDPVRVRAGVRDEPLRPDAHARPLARGCGLAVRVPGADRRLVRRRDHRHGRGLQRALRRAARAGGQGRRAVRDPAQRRQQLAAA